MSAGVNIGLKIEYLLVAQKKFELYLDPASIVMKVMFLTMENKSFVHAIVWAWPVEKILLTIQKH